MVLEKLLALVAAGEQLWNLRLAPNDEGFLPDFVFSFLFLLVEVGKLDKCLFESFCFEAVGADDDQVYLVLSQ